MPMYNVTSNQADRLNLREAASSEGREAASADYAAGVATFDRDIVSQRADAAFDYNNDQPYVRQSVQRAPDGVPEVDEREEPWVDDPDEAREWFIGGFIDGYLDALRGYCANSIEDKLGIAYDELNALFGLQVSQHSSIDGNAVADRIAERYGLPDDWRVDGGLGEQLYGKDVLTKVEGEYLDDQD